MPGSVIVSNASEGSSPVSCVFADAQKTGGSNATGELARQARGALELLRGHSHGGGTRCDHDTLEAAKARGPSSPNFPALRMPREMIAGAALLSAAVSNVWAPTSLRRRPASARPAAAASSVACNQEQCPEPPRFFSRPWDRPRAQPRPSRWQLGHWWATLPLWRSCAWQKGAVRRRCRLCRRVPRLHRPSCLRRRLHGRRRAPCRRRRRYRRRYRRRSHRRFLRRCLRRRLHHPNRRCWIDSRG